MSESFAALRLLAWPALAWLAGNAVHLLGTGIWPAGWALALLLGSAFLASTARHRPALLAAAAAVMAFGLAEARAGWRLAERLPAAADGSDLVLVGTVASLPRRTLQATRFEFAVESARLDGSMVSVPGRVLVSWHRGFDGDALLQGPPPEIRSGQRWSLPVRLRPPRGALNPHGFDFELWLFERGIRATGHVRARPGAVAVLLDEAACCIVDRARQRVRDAIDARVTDAGAAGVLAALAVGDQAAIDLSVDKQVLLQRHLRNARATASKLPKGSTSVQPKLCAVLTIEFYAGLNLRAGLPAALNDNSTQVSTVVAGHYRVWQLRECV